jgi:hypothetical protein
MSFNGYNIVNVGTGFYLDLAYADPAQGTPVFAQTKNPTPTLNQQVGICSTLNRSPSMSLIVVQTVEGRPRRCGQGLVYSSMRANRYICLLEWELRRGSFALHSFHLFS